MRKALFLPLVLLPCLPAVAGDAPQRALHSGEMVTRQVKQFGDLEHQLIAAINAKDANAVGQLLADDYSLRVNTHPEDPANRAESVAQVMAGNALSSHLEHISALDYGNVAVVSFSWILNTANSDASAQQIFVVDTWKRVDDHWKIAARYASPVGNTNLLVPGDVRHAVAPNKKI